MATARVGSSGVSQKIVVAECTKAGSNPCVVRIMGDPGDRVPGLRGCCLGIMLGLGIECGTIGRIQWARTKDN